MRLALLVLLAIGTEGAVPPTIVHVVADDLGWNDLGFSNGGKTHTPHINQAVKEGIQLKYYYTWKVCSPSRASIMTGRYPWGVGYYDMDGAEAVPLEFEMLPAVLKKYAGYETHALGKWNLGHLTKEYTPTFRGFDSFLGYYLAAQPDYWYHGSSQGCCAGPQSHNAFCTDLSKSAGAMVADGVKGAPDALNGTYNSEIFTSEAVRLIHEHAKTVAESQKPLYLYVAYMNVHSAGKGTLDLHAPCEVIDDHYTHVHSDTYKGMGGMLTMLDYGVGNITAALKAARHPYVLILHSDNGGPPLDGSTNGPLRYGKHTMWEGGVRVRSFVTGNLIPKGLQGSQFTGLAHSSDWYVTLVEGIANVSVPFKSTCLPTSSSVCRYPDGVNLWPAMLSGKYPAHDPVHPGPRKEIIHQVVNKHSTSPQMSTNAPATITKLHKRPGTNDYTYYKLMLGRDNPARKHNAIVWWPDSKANPVQYGKSGGTRNLYPEESGMNRCRAPGINKDEAFYDPQAADCTNGCLFDIGADPSEKKNLFSKGDLKHIVTDLKKRLRDAARTGPPWAIPFAGQLKAKLAQQIRNKTCATGYLEPVRTHAQPSSSKDGGSSAPDSLETTLVV